MVYIHISKFSSTIKYTYIYRFLKKAIDICAMRDEIIMINACQQHDMNRHDAVSKFRVVIDSIFRNSSEDRNYASFLQILAQNSDLHALAIVSGINIPVHQMYR
eukprot:SAG11_NODE_9389_length_916_cov_3.487148_1_plen_104_part_00